MIYFFADDHFGTHPGKVLFEALSDALKQRITFCENDFALLEEGAWCRNCELLILNMIGTICGLPHPGKGAEYAVKSYLEAGGSALLLHGSSAAFWQWDWWRTLVGLRWVRPGDPDGVPVSTHPTAPCVVTVAKVRHELAKKLAPIELPADEIYTELEQVCPVTILMETTVNGKTFPQCYECATPWGGRMVGFIPGHKCECVQKTVGSVTTLIDHLLKHKGTLS